MTGPERWMAQQLRALAALQEDWFPLQHLHRGSQWSMTQVSRDPKTPFSTLQASGIEVVYRHTYKYAHTYTIKIKGKNMVAITEIIAILPEIGKFGLKTTLAKGSSVK